MKVGTKKCFFTCIYRNPSAENNTNVNVDNFCTKLSDTFTNINGKNSYVNFVVGDLNAKNSTWWGDVTDYPGEKILDATSSNGLHQIITEPTHFYPGKTPSCIDLIFCSQPIIVLESGTLPSLLPQCHHSMV